MLERFKLQVSSQICAHVLLNLNQMRVECLLCQRDFHRNEFTYSLAKLFSFEFATCKLPRLIFVLKGIVIYFLQKRAVCFLWAL